MVVSHLSEYVAFHQAKLREEQAKASASASGPAAPAKKYSGVNQIHSKKSFHTSVVDGSKDTLVVLDCFATWCGPCKVIAPKVEKFSEEYGDVKFYKIDVDESPDVAQELGIRAMPTFMFFKNGEKIEEVVGANERAIQAAIHKHRN